VGLAPAGGDLSYDPALGTPIRTGAQQIVRLANPTTGALAAGVTATKTRLLTLNEIMGMGGPLEILVNNTKWSGMRHTATAMEPITTISSTTGKLDRANNLLTELPTEGNTEVWEIVNLTADAHPIHLHLVQFQILNRQNFNVSNYLKVYNAAFPAAFDFTTNTTTAGGVFVPGYGPPSDYFSTAKPGGNPDVTKFLQGAVMPPDPNEAGWKDTAIMMPGQVTRIVVRFAPMDIPTTQTTGLNYPFDPNLNNYSYVWHCHIVDHEDNEMMRPYQVKPQAVSRSYNQGVDY
jgi:FtsP/CotA-like multicopper oxidase with cupredoxin domain